MEKQSSYIFNFSKFLLLVILIASVLGYAIDSAFEEYIIFRSEINGASKINRILKIYNPDEIPIFGSSRAEGSFVPSVITDEPCFNYGIAGTQANIWLFFLEEELKRNKHTDIIINLDVLGLIYSDGYFGNYIPNYSETERILNQKGGIQFYIPFIRYFGYFEHYIKDYLHEKWNLTKVTISGGRLEKNPLTPKKFAELVYKRENEPIEVLIENKLLNKLGKLIESTDRRIFFLVSPYHSSYLEQVRNVGKVDSFLYRLNKIKNVTVLDLRSYFTSDSVFSDTHHLNHKGAFIFSEEVRVLLQTDSIRAFGYGISLN